jgi:hypothetical protein
MKNLTITEKYIKTTKNNVLREMLTCMKEEISNRVEKIALQIDSKFVTKSDKDFIEVGLIYDLCKSVIVYTEDTDKISNFTSMTSIKGNLEIIGTIIRDNKEYYFATECIIAEGMIQKRHFRYITKTDLKKSGNLETANEVKIEVKRMNKIQRMLDFISGQEKRKEKFQNELNELKKLSRQDWINKINNSEFPLLIENKEVFEERKTSEVMGWNTYEDYTNWINKTNEETIVRAMRRIETLETIITQINVNIEKENLKILKLKNESK